MISYSFLLFCAFMTGILEILGTQ